MIFRLLGPVLCLMATATAVIGGPLDRSLRPLPRPPITAPITAPVNMAGTVNAPGVSPHPRPRPTGKTVAAIVLASAPPMPDPTPSGQGSVCGVPSIKGQSIAPIAAKIKGCGLEEGVKITSVAGIELSEAAVLDCTTAKALESWVKTAVLPAVGNSGGGVESIQVAASYVCRPRNNQKGNRVSEHGRGRAIDVAAIVLQNGAVMSVLKDWGKGRYGKILKKIRKAACGPFTTVLGPGSDSYHRTHLHLDTARGRGPYCK